MAKKRTVKIEANPFRDWLTQQIDALHVRIAAAQKRKEPLLLAKARRDAFLDARDEWDRLQSREV